MSSGQYGCLQFGLGLEEVATSDRLSFDALARRILDVALPRSRYSPHTGNQYQAPPISQSPAQARSATLGVSMSPHPYTAGLGNSLSKPPAASNRPPARLEFKESPFFTIIEALTPVVECKSMSLWQSSVDHSSLTLSSSRTNPG
jgi:E3 SUMO-protein ligase PIAS1